jgi:hypothetical protein
MISTDEVSTGNPWQCSREAAGIALAGQSHTTEESANVTHPERSLIVE